MQGGDMSKNSFVKYLLYDIKAITRYPPANKYDQNDKPVKKTKEEYSLELERLKEAHPRVSAADIEQHGFHTHTLMTGGKFLFNDEPIPTNIEFPRAFADLHRGFREACPRLLGRRETYEDMFWLCLRHAVVNRRSWDLDACLTEVVSKPYMHFFLDLDLLFKAEHATAADWVAFVKQVCSSAGKAVLSCFPEVAASRDPNGDFEFSVMCTKGYRPKEITRNADADAPTLTVYKRGMHLVWPGLVVDKDRAECLARAIDERLTRDLPRDVAAGENSWKDAIDLSVYRSGLRPVGCAKITPCPKCRSIARKRVPTGMSYEYSARYMDYMLCHPPSGFISQGEESVYVLTHISRADGVVFSPAKFKMRIEAHILKDEASDRSFDFSLRKWTSIRATAAEKMTPGFQPPSHLRRPIVPEYTDYRTDIRQDPETGDYLPPSKKKRQDPKGAVWLNLTVQQLEAMTEVLRVFHPARYANIVIDRVLAFPSNDPKHLLPPRQGEAPRRALYRQMWFLVKGEGSDYCFNKPGTHGSNKIRFHVDFEGNIHQSCWSHKEYGGKPCSKKTTKGQAGFNNKVTPKDYGVLVDIFTTAA